MEKLPESYEERRALVREILTEDEQRKLKKLILYTMKKEGLEEDEARKKVLMRFNTLKELREFLSPELKKLNLEKEMEGPLKELYDSLEKGKPVFLSILKRHNVRVRKYGDRFIVEIDDRISKEAFDRFVAPYSKFKVESVDSSSPSMSP